MRRIGVQCILQVLNGIQLPTDGKCSAIFAWPVIGVLRKVSPSGCDQCKGTGYNVSVPFVWAIYTKLVYFFI